MRKLRQYVAMFFTAVLLMNLSLPTSITFAATGGAENEIDYNENVPADKAKPVEVAPDLDITASEGELFSGGNLTFSVEDMDESEKLILPEGKHTIDGQEIEVKNGEIFIGSDKIGSVNNSLDGDGKALQIDFDVIPVDNGDFEGEVDAQGNPVGWTINTSSPGYANQVWLGNLASKTRGKSYTYSSIRNIGNGKYSITGQGYSYVTDVNYQTAQTNSSATIFREGKEFPFQPEEQGTLIKEIANDNGNNSLKLGFARGRVDRPSGSGEIGTVFRADAWSPMFEAKAGDQLGFDWLAQGGNDDYEVYGFIVDHDGNHTELMYGRGKDQPWTTETGTIQADGEYQFRFVSGSFDRTDGKLLGAVLQIDNIRVLSGQITNDFTAKIGQLVTYETTDLLGDRAIKIEATNGTGQTKEVAKVPVLMDTEHDRAFTVEAPANGATVDEETPTITGKALSGSEVSVTLTGPDGYEYTGDATIDDNGNWSMEIPEALKDSGDYTITAKATHTDYPEATEESTFTFVDKSVLDDYVNKDLAGLEKDDYRAGWDAYEEALNRANDVLDNPQATQAEVASALTDLVNAKEALEKHPPQAEKAHFKDGTNEIVVDFDKAITADNEELDLTDGFTILVDGKEVDVKSAEIIADGDQVKVTLADGTTLSSDVDIEIRYNKEVGNANITGDEANATAVEDYTLSASDSFGKAFQIEGPKGITNNTSPTINGTIDPKAEQTTITLVGSGGKEIIIDEDEITINDDGTWSYDVAESLMPGDYEVKVTTSKKGRPDITKSHSFTVVNKAGLENRVADIAEEELSDDIYTPDSIAAIQDALDAAAKVLDNPNATQAEVDEALANLDEARQNVVEKPLVKLTAPMASNIMTATPEFKGTATPGSEVTVKISDDLILTTTADGNGNWSVTPEKALADGEYEVEVMSNKDGALSNPTTKKLTIARLPETDGVDRSLLQGLKEDIDEQNLAAHDYTADSFAQLQKELDNADKVLRDENATQDEIDAAMNNLANAYKGLEEVPAAVDKSLLAKQRDFINDKELDAEVYTEATWNALVEALDRATNVLANDSATQEEVDAALKHLVATYAGLEETEPSDTVDKSLLSKLSNDVTEEDLASENYTTDSWNALVVAQEEAARVLADDDATQAEVTAALNNLAGAYTGLQPKPKVDKTLLTNFHNGVVNENPAANDYTPSSWAVYDKALRAAKSVLADDNATQAEVDEALVALSEAYTALTKQADKTDLQGLTDHVGDVNPSAYDYTSASWDDYNQALKAAMNVLQDANATQEEVDAAFEALEAAYVGLVERTKPTLEVEGTEPGNVYHENPIFTGSSNAKEVTIEIKDQDGNVIETATVPVNEDGTWSYTPKHSLSYGYYTMFTSATVDGETITEKREITIEEETKEPVVDKSKLDDKQTNIIDENLDEKQYTADSWNTLQTAIAEAKRVLADENATQAEVDAALKALDKAYAGLAKKQVKEPTAKPEPTPAKPGKPEKPLSEKNSVSNSVTNKTGGTGEEVTGKKLPSTATPIYSQLAFGFIILMTGLLFAFVYRRKTNN